MPRYDRAYGYDYGYRRPGPFTGWYPAAYAAGAPLFGWAGWEGAGVWGWPPYAPIGYGGYGYGAYDYGYTPRRRPEESPTYGRGADEAARRFAQSHGYDEGYTIRPHFRGSPRRDFGRYDRTYRGKW